MKKVLSILVLLMSVLLAACSGANQQLTPTIDVGALQTASVQTVVANVTRTAEAMPSATPEPSATLEVAAAVTPVETVTPTLAVSPTQGLCDDAAFVSDASVIDGSQMTAGAAFVKTWKVKNTGTCTWTTGYQIIFAYNEKMGGLPTALSTEVQPGAEVEVSVNLVAPTKPGNYSGYWRLSNNNGFAFGQFLSVVIVVP